MLDETLANAGGMLLKKSAIAGETLAWLSEQRYRRPWSNGIKDRCHADDHQGKRIRRASSICRPR
ncbi:MAG: hypothetical protein U5O39_11730 [Gammaproteobacteria bacterium]|nr:hypothetical protein [Gammaproteobacteria bacterium]